MDETDKPPSLKSSLRQPTSIRVRSGSSDRSITRRRKMAFIQHLSSPMLASRFRNDLVILENI